MENLEEASDQLKDLPLEVIYWLEPTDITEDQIKNMGLSLMVHGQIQPIVVNARDEKGYRGVIGRLRYEGMRYRWRNEPEGKTIQARIRKFEGEIELKMWQLAENLHRREISAMQRARQYRALYDLLKEEHGKAATIQTLATAIEDITGNQESIKTVQHYLSLTKLEPKTQEVLTGEKLGLRYGLQFVRLKDPEKQVRVAEAVKEDREYYSSVDDVKYRVDGIIAEERTKTHNERLKKKAEELRAEGKTVFVGRFLSSEEEDQFHQWYTGIPEGCQGCDKLGILLQANFHQEQVCMDPACWKKKQEDKREKEAQEDKERTKVFDEERAKVHEMEPDIRHWRLAVYGLIDNWELRSCLGLKRGKWDRAGLDETLWKKVQGLEEEECKKLLIRHAVEEVLTGPRRWGEDPCKTWAVEEFGLKRELFLAEEE